MWFAMNVLVEPSVITVQLANFLTTHYKLAKFYMAADEQLSTTPISRIPSASLPRLRPQKLGSPELCVLGQGESKARVIIPNSFSFSEAPTIMEHESSYSTITCRAETLHYYLPHSTDLRCRAEGEQPLDRPLSPSFYSWELHRRKCPVSCKESSSRQGSFQFSAAASWSARRSKLL